jgi:hypothetical protein
MKEAPGSSETSVLTRATRRNNPEDAILQFITMLTSYRYWSASVIKLIHSTVLHSITSSPIKIVTCGTFLKKRLSKQRPLLGNDRKQQLAFVSLTRSERWKHGSKLEELLGEAISRRSVPKILKSPLCNGRKSVSSARELQWDRRRPAWK